MWETSQGTRTLADAEAHLVRELVHYLHDQILVGIEIGESHYSGVRVFDALQPTQQLVMLHHVALGLLDADTSPSTLTAISEATIYALFRELETLIEAEIEFDSAGSVPDNQIRTMACRAYLSGAGHDGSEDEVFGDLIPPLASTNMNQWSEFVEALADNILWDRDFQLDRLVSDAAPDHAHIIKTQLGINADYYSSIADDVLAIDVAELSQQIRHQTPATVTTGRCA